MKRLFLLAMSVFLLAGCEYFGRSEFILINHTSKKVVIKTLIGPYDLGVPLDDSIHSIAKDSVLQFNQHGGLIYKHSVPLDNYGPSDTIPRLTRFDIYIDGMRYDTLRLRRFWTYSARETVGTYTLTIDQELLDKL